MTDSPIAATQGSPNPDAPGNSSPAAPGGLSQVTPETASPATSGNPGSAVPGDPGQAVPGASGAAMPDNPSSAVPGTPSPATPDNPSPAMSGAPDPTTTPSTPIRLLLADDHPVVRAGLRAVLETEPGIVVVAEAATAEEAVTRAAQGDIDVVLMDLQFGRGMGGAEATARITARPAAPRVLIVTTYDSDADTLPAIEAGATGYLLKDAHPEELAAAVRTAAAGRTALAPTVADRLMNRLRSPAVALTRRETEVLTLVAEGLSNQAIGRRLHLTEGTVKSHLARTYTKLGVDSRTAAVATATDLGLIRR